MVGWHPRLPPESGDPGTFSWGLSDKYTTFPRIVIRLLSDVKRPLPAIYSLAVEPSDPS